MAFRNFLGGLVSDLILFILFAAFFFYCGMVGVVLWGISSVVAFIFLMRFRRTGRFDIGFAIIALFWPLVLWWVHLEPKFKRAFGGHA